MHSAKAIQIALCNLRRKTFVSTTFKNIARNSSITTWNMDWKPGPYPRTEEERIAAAKKYNLIPEDYKPYPEEEGYGDYPMFDLHHAESRNQHAPYDFAFLKRDFGEPVHPDFEMSLEDRLNFQTKHPIPIWQQFLLVLGATSLYIAVIMMGVYFPMDNLQIPKQDPLSGQLHYTFEPEEE